MPRHVDINNLPKLKYDMRPQGDIDNIIIGYTNRNIKKTNNFFNENVYIYSLTINIE